MCIRDSCDAVLLAGNCIVNESMLTGNLLFTFRKIFQVHHCFGCYLHFVLISKSSVFTSIAGDLEFLILGDFVRYWRGPVSYTHLDVYKRQVFTGRDERDRTAPRELKKLANFVNPFNLYVVLLFFSAVYANILVTLI